MPFAGSLNATFTNFHSHPLHSYADLLFSGQVDVNFDQARRGDLYSVVSSGFKDVLLMSAWFAEAFPGRLICNATTRVEKVGSQLFDRRPRVKCIRWHFAKGDYFTAVSFVRPRMIHDGINQFHSHWLIWYWAEDNQAHYTVSARAETADVDLPVFEGPLDYTKHASGQHVFGSTLLERRQLRYVSLVVVVTLGIFVHMFARRLLLM